MVLKGHNRIVKIQSIVDEMKQRFQLLKRNPQDSDYNVKGYSDGKFFVIAYDEDETTYSIKEISHSDTIPPDIARVKSITIAMGIVRNLLMKTDFNITNNTYFLVV